MDLEKLTKHQIVLLMLLVSLVTSIATGIVTVSLMDQAPVSVTRTINQIVEHTVEKVVPAPEGQTATVVHTEKTVVVKDDDLAAQSIAKVQQALIRIVTKSSPDTLVARGVIVTPQGAALTDRAALLATGERVFEAILQSGERVGLSVRTGSSAVATIDLSVGTSTVASVGIAESSKLQLGQSVIRIGGTGADTVGMGVIAALPSAHGSLIQTSVSSATPGSVLMTLFGEIVGIITSASLAVGPEFYSIP